MTARRLGRIGELGETSETRLAVSGDPISAAETRFGSGPGPPAMQSGREAPDRRGSPSIPVRLPPSARASGSARRVDWLTPPGGKGRGQLSATHPASALAVDDEAAGRIVGRDRDGDPVAEHHADPVAADLAGELGQDLVAVVELDPKVTALRDQDDFAVEMNELFFAHGILWCFFAYLAACCPAGRGQTTPLGPLVSTIWGPGEALRSQG